MLFMLVVGIVFAILVSGILSFVMFRRLSTTKKIVLFVLVFVFCVWGEHNILLEWKAISRRRQLRTMCMLNLKQIHLALHMYKDSEGTYPDSLKSLYPGYLSDKRVLYCPRLLVDWSINNTDMAGVSGSRVPEYVSEWSHGMPEKVDDLSEIDYLYRKPGVGSSPHDILVEERKLNHLMGLRNTEPVRLFIQLNGMVGERNTFG